jgi:hypothetical protein
MLPSAEDFTYYPYPYHGFPTIESHVHPRFIICNSGSKLDRAKELFKWQKSYEMSTIADLARVQDIWNSWRRTVLTDEFLRMASKGGDPDIRDDNSQKTSYRVLRSTLPKRKAPGEQASPTPKSSKQRALQDGGAWLDDDTLHEFDRQSSSQDDHKIPKNLRIREWLSGFSDSKGMAEVQAQGELECRMEVA